MKKPTQAKHQVTFREVTESERGDSWKLMMGFAVINPKRPPKGVKIIRAGTFDKPVPRSLRYCPRHLDQPVRARSVASSQPFELLAHRHDLNSSS